jgi:Glycosyl hydrolases family 16
MVAKTWFASFLLFLLPFNAWSQGLLSPCKYCKRLDKDTKEYLINGPFSTKPVLSNPVYAEVLNLFPVSTDDSVWLKRYPYPAPSDRAMPGYVHTSVDSMIGIGSNSIDLSTSRTPIFYEGITREWASGILHTRDKAPQDGCFRFGRYEVTFSLPKNRGQQFAIWMFGWAGEIDGIEMNGCNPSLWQSNIHTGGYGDGHRYEGKIHTLDPDIAYHTLVYEWTENSVTWTIDGQLVRTMHYYYTRSLGRAVPQTRARAIELAKAGKPVWFNRLMPDPNHFLDLIISNGIGSDFSRNCGLNSAPLPGHTGDSVVIKDIKVEIPTQLSWFQKPDSVENPPFKFGLFGTIPADIVVERMDLLNGNWQAIEPIFKSGETIEYETSKENGEIIQLRATFSHINSCQPVRLQHQF